MSTNEIEIEEHPFLPFVPENAKTLIIGSFPGMEQVKNKNSENEWFYSAAGNQFWEILATVYNTDLSIIQSRKELFQRHGIAITDIFHKIKRKIPRNLDKHIIAVAYNDKAIRSILESKKIETILFTSKFVEKHFQRLFPDVRNTQCLPSPSGAANIPISISEEYKNYRIQYPQGDIKTYRIHRYKKLLQQRHDN